MLCRIFVSCIPDFVLFLTFSPQNIFLKLMFFRETVGLFAFHFLGFFYRECPFLSIPFFIEFVTNNSIQNRIAQRCKRIHKFFLIRGMFIEICAACQCVLKIFRALESVSNQFL